MSEWKGGERVGGGGRRLEVSAELCAPRRDALRRTAAPLRVHLCSRRFDEKARSRDKPSRGDFCRTRLPSEFSPPRPVQPLHQPHLEEEKGSDLASLTWTAAGQPLSEAPESSDTLCMKGRQAALIAEPRHCCLGPYLPSAPGHVQPAVCPLGFPQNLGS